MDSQDIFRKLSVGAKFNFKKFRTDAQKLQIVKTKALPILENAGLSPESQPDTRHVKKELIPKTHTNFDDEITLLGSMTTTSDRNNDGLTKKKKKKIVSSKEKVIQLKEEEIRHFRNVQHISVLGKDVPVPVDSFENLGKHYGVSQVILDNLTKCGFPMPTPIQMQALPIMLKRRQLLACAPTGSGKTAAFLVPILNHLAGPMRKGFRAVVVCPTRELARQTYRESLLLGEGLGLRIHIISKVSHATDKFGPKSSQRFDVLITTPNRLIYLLRQDPPAIELKSVEWLVVDESDKLFEAGPQGFRDQLAEIYRACDTDTICRAMFSATHIPDVAKWAKQNLKRLITVTVGQRNTASDKVDQELLYVGNESGKLVAIRNIIQKGLTPPVLVFVQSKVRAKELFDELIYDGINVDVIHADRTQTQRDNVVRCFREGKIWVLICTELMGRGIDFKGVNLVINYDFPPSAIAYIHRIGRTGRAGRTGKAVTFFTQDDSLSLRSIAQVMKDSGCEVPSYMLSIKKASKRDRRKLERRAPSRDGISTIPVHERRRKERLKHVIKNNKRKKIEASEIAGSTTKKAKKIQDT